MFQDAIAPLFIGPGGIGAPELGIIVLLVVLLFGADKLPKLARGAGEAMGEFRKAKQEADKELQEVTEEVEATTSESSSSSTSTSASSSEESESSGSGSGSGSSSSTSD